MVEWEIPEEWTRKGAERKTFELFLKSRKNDKTREYTLSILEYLSNKLDEDLVSLRQYGKPDKVTSSRRSVIKQYSSPNLGWVRTKDLFEKVKIPNESTFHQLLKNLLDAKLIEKKEERLPGLVIEPGKTPTWYRVPGLYPKKMLSSREDLEKELDAAYVNMAQISMRLTAAMKLLKVCHKNDMTEYDVDDAVMKETRRLYENYDDPIIP